MGTIKIILVAFPLIISQGDPSKIFEEVYGRRLKESKSPLERFNVLLDIMAVARDDSRSEVRDLALQRVFNLAPEFGFPALGLEAAVGWGVSLRRGNEPVKQLLEAAEDTWTKAEELPPRDRLRNRLEAIKTAMSALPPSRGSLEAKMWEKRIEDIQSEWLFVLPPRAAKIVGHRATYLEEYQILFNWRDPREYFEWTIELPGGQFVVELRFGASDLAARSVYGVTMSSSRSYQVESRSSFQVPSTGALGRYQRLGVCLITTKRQSEKIVRLHVLRAHPSDVRGSEFINIKGLALHRYLPPSG